MSLPLYQVDAFAERPFEGNPAGVVLLDAPRPDAWMQAVAAEMNLAETSFLLPAGDGWSLRWFTPTVEVDLCGHATLAAAHVLWSTGAAPAGRPLAFETRSGRLGARRDGTLIELDFPATPPDAATADDVAAVREATGLAPRWIGRSRFDLVARLAHADDIAAFVPDFARIARLAARGLILTAPGDDGRHHFVSRFFGPQSGVPEDPVTGSAHCALAPYWGAEFDRTEMLGRQCSLRGGTVRVRLDGDRVRLAGGAVTTIEGRLLA